MSRFCYELNGGGTVELEDILGRELHAGDYVCVGAHVQLLYRNADDSLVFESSKSVLILGDSILVAEDDDGKRFVIGKRIYSDNLKVLSVCLLTIEEGINALQNCAKYRSLMSCTSGFDVAGNNLYAGDLVLFTDCMLSLGTKYVMKKSIGVRYSDESSLQFNIGIVVGNNEFFDGKRIVKDMVVWKLSTSSSELVNRKTELNQAYNKFATCVVNVRNNVVTVGDTFIFRNRYYTCTKVYNRNGKRSYEYLKFHTDKDGYSWYLSSLLNGGITREDVKRCKEKCYFYGIDVVKKSDKAIGEFVGHFEIKK